MNLLVTLFNFSIYFHSDGADVLKYLLASKADSNEPSNTVKKAYFSQCIKFCTYIKLILINYNDILK